MARRVAILSDLASRGGAAIAANRLADALRGTGDDVVRISGSDGPSGQDQRLLRAPARGIVTRILDRLTPWATRSRAQVYALARELDRGLRHLRPDVINVHNLHHFPGASHEYIDELVRVAARHAPVVWTLHDMWSFTGRCTHAFDCGQFVSGCTPECPTLDHTPHLDRNRIRAMWNRRHRLFEQFPGLTAVTPSRWLAEVARKGFWQGHRVETIANSLSLQTFEPIDRELARRALGLHTRGPVVLVSSLNIDDPRKGVALLTDAIRQVPVRPITLLAMGNVKGDRTNLHVDEEVVVQSLGMVRHERMRALTYAAADVLAHPSLAENLPNVIAEAHACGTPAVGFAVGGVPEMIDSEHLGRTVPSGSVPALADAITTMCDASGSEARRRHCREAAEHRYSPARQAKGYRELFARLQS